VTVGSREPCNGLNEMEFRPRPPGDEGEDELDRFALRAATTNGIAFAWVRTC
jgi:hypothetical protein